MSSFNIKIQQLIPFLQSNGTSTTAMLTAGSSAAFGTLVQLLTPLAITLCAYTFYKLLRFIWSEYVTNSSREFPGPPSASWLYGNMRQIWDAESSVMHEKWVEEYGTTIKYRSYFGVRQFTVSVIETRS